MVQLKAEAVQLIGGILAFGPQAIVIKDLVKDVLPAEIIPVGYLLLTVGIGWEVIQMIKDK